MLLLAWPKVRGSGELDRLVDVTRRSLGSALGIQIRREIVCSLEAKFFWFGFAGDYFRAEFSRVFITTVL
jgi:hypothetical protein